jgi:hypothetical protein
MHPMSVTYRCPGTTSYGRGMSETTVHAGGCCAAFTLMSAERRQAIGLRYAPAPDPIIAIEEAIEEPITVGELIEVVRLLQLADDEGLPAPVSHVQRVLVEHDFPQAQLDALLDLGAGYGLVAHCTRLPAGPGRARTEEGS